jgi:predicted CoA-binding protein
MPLTTDSEIKALLENAKHVAVVGYSTDETRPSHQIAHRLVTFGYQMSPINPTAKSTPDLTIYPSLEAAPQPIDIVDIFRRSDAVPEVVEEAIKVGAKAIWMQLGIENEAAAKRAEEAGLKVVMNRCIKVEHLRLF